MKSFHLRQLSGLATLVCLLAPAAAAQSSDRTARSEPVQPVFTVQPEYTPKARSARLQGSVLLYLELSPAGEPEKVETLQGLGLGLDEKAVEAVKQWRFAPNSVRVQQSAEVTFQLSPEPSWRVARADYHLNPPGKVLVRQITKPELMEYKAPDDGPCISGGGPVIVELQIDKQGKPSHVELVEEHGQGSAEAVIQAAAAWRFQPGLTDGKAAKFKGVVVMECRNPAAAVGSNAPLHIGKGVSAPVLLYHPEPEYSEEARRARYSGTVVLALHVDTTGRPASICVIRSLGLGLDEKAMAAVSQWRFQPAMKNGAPVTVLANLQVNFRLL